MKRNNQNNENQYESLVSDLKNLPGIKVPSDFEYKLMIRIQNGQFEKVKKEKANNRLWSLIPASALVLSAVVIFFVVQETSIQQDHNYLTIEPQPYSNNYKIRDTLGIREKKDKQETYHVVVNNDAIIEEKVEKPSNSPVPVRGMSLDNYLASPGVSGNKKGILVKSSPDFGDEGFYMNSYEDEQEMLRLKARMDSIAQSRIRKK